MGSDAGGERAAAIYSLVETAKLNGLDPQGYLPRGAGRIADHRSTASTSCCPGTLPVARRTNDGPPEGDRDRRLLVGVAKDNGVVHKVIDRS